MWKEFNCSPKIEIKTTIRYFVIFLTILTKNTLLDNGKDVGRQAFSTNFLEIILMICIKAFKMSYSLSQNSTSRNLS